MSYGFTLRWKGKPAPARETVTIQVHEVRCGCGVLWLAPPDLTAPGCACPECGDRAAPGRIGAATAVATVTATEGGSSSSVPTGGSITFTSATLGQIRCLIPAVASAALPNETTTLVYELTVTNPAGVVFTAIDSTIVVTMSV